MKNKNIRAKLKKQSLDSSNVDQSLLKNSNDREINDINKSSEVEISFNITPDDEDLKKSIYMNNGKISEYKKNTVVNCKFKL